MNKETLKNAVGKTFFYCWMGFFLAMKAVLSSILLGILFIIGYGIYLIVVFGGWFLLALILVIPLYVGAMFFVANLIKIIWEEMGWGF